MSDPYQGESWCDPNGSREVRGLVARILFPTDDATLDRKDVAALQRLRGPYQIMMLGHRIHFWCVGHTDKRASDRHNLALGRSRAIAVRRQLDEIFGRSPLYSGSAVESLGRQQAHKDSPTREQMAQDRQVEVYASRLPRRPPIDLPMERIIGRKAPRIRFREVHHRGIPVASYVSWSLASPISRPTKLSNLPGDRTGNHPASVIPVIAELSNHAVVALCIKKGLEKLRPIVAWNLLDHETGGILVIAAIDVCKPGAIAAGRVMFVTDFPGVYRGYREAIDRWRRQPRLEVSAGAPRHGHVEYKFFWATRA